MPRHHGIAAGVSLLYQIDEDAVSIALRNLPTEVQKKIKKDVAELGTLTDEQLLAMID